MDDTANNIYFYRLKVHDIGRTQCSPCAGACEYGRSGFFTKMTTTNITFDSNEVYNIGRLPGGCYENDYNHDHGMYLSGSYNTIINNLFYDNTAGWSVLLAPYTTTTGHKIINNTFYGSTQRSGLSGQIIVMANTQDALIQRPGRTGSRCPSARVK